MLMKKTIKPKTLKLFGKLSDIVAPPPDLSVSEWADSFRRLSSESSAEPGVWRTDRAPYQREILDSINNPYTEEIILMTSSQVGKTEVILNTIGFHIDFDPAPIMVIQPTVEMANTFSKTRLAPMIRDTPALKGKVSSEKSRDSGNTIREKSFPGGVIVMVGANAPAGLASRPIRILLADEVDRFPISAGTEGDPLTLATKRTNTFSNRKKIFVSTPTIKGASRIERAYEASTKGKWSLPCPSCGEHQTLSWDLIKFEPPSMICGECGSIHEENEWKSKKGKWIHSNPERKSKGFHLNELASPWKSWAEVIEDFKTAKKNGREQLKAWVNTSLGETWEEEGEGLESDELIDRREAYPAEVPDDVVLLTCGVDVQGNRLEYEIVGWGVGKNSWGIKYGVIMGDPGQEFVWNQLDDVLFETYQKEDGQEMKVMATCIDSGGHHTQEVYEYCKANEFNRVFAIKGQGGSGNSFIKKPKRRNEAKVWLFLLGVDTGKDTIMSRLKADETQNGYCRFPSNSEKGYDDQYFTGLTAEQKVLRYKQGQAYYKWELRGSNARNEPLDIRNYATAALEILNPNLEKLASRSLSDAEGKKAVKRKSKKRRGVVSKGAN